MMETSTKTTVVNLRSEPFDVYIGRAGHGYDGYFGNPHVVGYCQVCKTEHDRDGAISAFRKYFEERIAVDQEFREQILACKGKRLGCFCRPRYCHGDVIADWLDTVTMEGKA